MLIQASPPLSSHFVPATSNVQQTSLSSEHDASPDTVPLCREHWTDEEQAPPIALQGSAAVDAVAIDNVVVALELSEDHMTGPDVAGGKVLVSVGWQSPEPPPHV